ncbi:GNAT family N-acetyltransferase [Streptomyces sp. 4N509B]|uniref:GNAT family N-acetyltransferase n=1 Tax=Streptomyces sp. 4N509B TaxID=3457413 RepID=UPI003FCFF2FD
MRRARHADLAAVLHLLSQDALPAPEVEIGPGDPVPRVYVEAFERIDADPGQLLAVAELDGAVVGTLQLSFVPYLTRRGTPVAMVEAVRVDRRLRRRGVGEHMMRWALGQARARGCVRVQLTSNKARADAHRFYERLGFRATHEGMKLHLDARDSLDALHG